MPSFSTLSSVLAMALTMSGTQAAAVASAPCTAFGPADEFYYKLSGHSSPLYGVSIDSKSGVLSAVATRDTNVQFQFEKCIAPATGYIQGQPIQAGFSPEYFGHVRHVSSGKCLKHRDGTLDFVLAACPTTNDAAAQLPFWFEDPNETGSVRWTGYKNTTAYPQPAWFAVPTASPPFTIVTQQAGPAGVANQWVLARPIRV